jgi:hypothetical protein
VSCGLVVVRVGDDGSAPGSFDDTGSGDERGSAVRVEIGESARWHDGRLWLAHWGAAEVLAIDLAGNTEVMARVPPTIPFSIDWLPGGRLLVNPDRRAGCCARNPTGR